MPTKTINLTKESERAVDSLIKQNPDFNFSGWIQRKLLEEFEGKASSIYTIENELTLLLAEEKTLWIRIKSLMNKKIELLESEEKRLFEKEQAQKREERLKTEEKKFISVTFSDEVGREMTEQEFSNYKAELESGFVNSLWDWIEVHKLKNMEVIDGKQQSQ